MDYQSFQPGGQNQGQVPQMPSPVDPILRKTFTLKFIGIIVLLLVLGAGAYGAIWYWQKQQLAQEVAPTFTPRANETAGWKTYTNTQYGFEFKYPIAWGDVKFEKKQMSFPGYGSYFYGQFINNSNCEFGSISNDFRNESEPPSFMFVGENPKQIKLSDSHPATLYESYHSADPNEYQLPDSTSLEVKLKNSDYNFLRIGCWGSFQEPYKISEADNNGFNQILSTFKFIDSTDISTWKTYANTQYGFEIQYPSDWSVIRDSIYGPNADLASIHIKYYESIKDLPSNPVSHKSYDYFDQYVMDAHFFIDQKLISLNSGTVKSAVLVQDPSIKMLLIGGNGHFYEISYQIRYSQTLSQLDQILSTFKFLK